jgi:hypothetical protein
MSSQERTLLLAVARGLRNLIVSRLFLRGVTMDNSLNEINAALKPFDEADKVHSKRERWEKRDKPCPG